MDMRRQIDGLAAIVQHEMQLDPFSRSVFVFLNKRRDKAKLLVWERNGYVLWYKRLEKQRFTRLRSDAIITLSVKELNMLLDGYDIEQFRPHHPVKLKNTA